MRAECDGCDIAVGIEEKQPYTMAMVIVSKHGFQPRPTHHQFRQE